MPPGYNKEVMEGCGCMASKKGEEWPDVKEEVAGTAKVPQASDQFYAGLQRARARIGKRKSDDKPLRPKTQRL